MTTQPNNAATTEKPTIWQRLAQVFEREKLDAKASYRSLLNKIYRGVELSDREVAELARSMREAGISQEELDRNLRLFQEHKDAQAATAAVQRLAARREALTSQIEKLDAAIADIMARGRPIHEELFQVNIDYGQLQARAAAAPGLQADIDKLFIA